MPGCTPVQPLVTLKKAFFLFAMNARKSYAASFCLDSREMTQCQLPPLVFPTAFSELFSHWLVSGLNASVVPGIMVAPTRPCTLECARSWARVGRSPQVGSITACPLKNTFQPCSSVQ